MSKKTKIISSFLVLLITACTGNPPVNTVSNSNTNINSKNLSVKSVSELEELPEPVATGEPVDISKIPKPPAIPVDQIKPMPKYDDHSMRAPSFDHVPPYDPNNIVPGAVTVIFKNSSKIRIDKQSKSVRSMYSSDSAKLNSAFSKYNLKGSSDLSLPDEPEEKLDALQREASKKSTTEIPNFKSIQYLTFPETADTKAISEELRKLPFVRTAYPTSTGQTSTSLPNTRISRFTTSNIKSSVVPTDSGFTSGSSGEQSKWWWFNRYKVFEGWKVYASEWNVNSIGTNGLGINNSAIQKPTIAVIDSGFDTGPRQTTLNATNRPNYIGGLSVGLRDPDDVNSGITGDYGDHRTVETIDDINYTGNTYSHGAHVASVLASKLGAGSSSHLAGIIPGATISPVKARQIRSDVIATAIRWVTDDEYSYNPDVISISLALKQQSLVTFQTIEVPVSINPDIGAAIWYASNTNGDKNVVIAAGNSARNLDQEYPPCPNGGSYPSCFDYGQIIVGASNSSGTILSLGVQGSNTGKIVDIVAGGENIYASTYDLSSPYYPTPPQTPEQSKSYYLLGASGTSEAVPMVSATIAMMRKMAQHKGISINSDQARDIVVYTSSLAMTYTGQHSTPVFLGRDLSKTSRNLAFRYLPNQSLSPYDQFAEMRELNVFNALSFIKNYTTDCTIVRLFNTDDRIQATTDNWMNYYADESYYYDSMYRFNAGAIPIGSTFAFDGYNGGGNGSYGYQVYNKGLLAMEVIRGVAAVYKPWLSSSTILNNPSYNTAGHHMQNTWYGGQYFYF